MTRWVSHLCAPVFVFLAGTALAISVERKVSKGIDIFGFTYVDLCDLDYGHQVSAIAMAGNDDSGLGDRSLPAVL